jgi:hypothetical protein
VRQAGLRHQEGAAGVDLVHEVVAFHGGIEGTPQEEGAGVVDADVDAAEGFDGFVDGVLDGLVVADVSRTGLPSRSAAPRGGYPVVYLNDGQNLFVDGLAFGGMSWRAGYAASCLIANGRLPPFIIVGIDNRGVKRGFAPSSPLPFPLA